VPTTTTRPNTFLRIPLGLRFMAGAALCFSLMALFVKLAGRTLPTMEIVFARSLFMAVFTFGLLRREGLAPLGNHRLLLFARGAIGVTALSLFYFAIPRLPLGDVTAIFYMAPIWTAFSAAFILRERTAGLVLAGIGTSLVGVALIARPTFLFGDGLGALDGLAVAAAVGASILSGLVYTIVRKLRATDAPNVIIFYLSWVGVVGALPFLGNWVLPTGWAWAWLLGAGLSTQLGQIFLTRGLHLERAGRAVSVGYLQVVFAFVWGALFFGTIPGLQSLAGAVLIVGSVLLIARRG
jgi:drug/metabolite transporter (DMT)-like permease